MTDTDLVLDHSHPIDPRKTIFVGGVPRPLRAGKFNLFLLQRSCIQYYQWIIQRNFAGAQTNCVTHTAREALRQNFLSGGDVLLPLDEK